MKECLDTFSPYPLPTVLNHHTYLPTYPTHMYRATNNLTRTRSNPGLAGAAAAAGARNNINGSSPSVQYGNGASNNPNRMSYRGGAYEKIEEDMGALSEGDSPISSRAIRMP